MIILSKNYIFLLVILLVSINVCFGFSNILIFGKFWKDGNAYPSLLLLINIFSIIIFFMTLQFEINQTYQLPQLIYKNIEFYIIFILYTLLYWFSISAPQYNKYGIVFFFVTSFIINLFAQKRYINYQRKRDLKLPLKHTLAIGNSSLMNDLMKYVANEVWLGFKFVDKIDEYTNFDEILTQTSKNNIQSIFIDTDIIKWDAKFESKLRNFSHKNHIPVYGLSNLYNGKFTFGTYNLVHEIPFINLFSLPFDKPLNKIIKRYIDIAASVFVFLFIFWWLIPIISLLIKINSKGPVFFTQERIGRDNKPFRIIKFRTMKVDAEKLGPMLSSTNDNRITSLGRVLRKYRIDEIPQFINVIKNDMSLVGPRPERKHYIEKIKSLEPNYSIIQNIKPGLTGLAQVYYKYPENVEEMTDRFKYELIYLKNFTIFLDIKIIFLTFLVIFNGKGK